MKTTFAIGLATLFGCGQWAAGQHGPTDAGLIAHWSFADGNGTALRDRVGGHDGKVHGAVWASHGGRTALRFDGSGDYVDFGDDPHLKIVGDLTIAAWIRLEAETYPDFSTNWTIADCERHKASGSILRINAADGTLLYRSSQRGTSQYGSSSTVLLNDRAYHVVLAKSGGNARLYVNGFAGPSFRVEDPAPGPAPFTISHASQSFSGLIYDVKMYNRALGGEEIVSVFNEGMAKYGVIVDPWYRPAPAALAVAPKAADGSGEDSMLISDRDACWVITSSNGNFGRLYSENVLDGDPNTSWRSFQETTEEWAEIKWDFEMLVGRVRVVPHELNRLATIELLVRTRGRWAPVALTKSVGDADGRVLEFSCDPPVATKRVRLVLRNETAGYAGLREVAVFGPVQPLLRIDSDEGNWVYGAVSDGPASPTGDDARTLAVESCVLDPPDPRPEQNVRLTVKLRPLQALPDGCALVVTIGEREMFFNRSDYTVTRVILRPEVPPSRWPVAKTRAIETDVYIPAHAPHGRLDVMLHVVPPPGRPSPRLVTATGGEVPDGRIGHVDIRRFGRDPIPDATSHTVRIDDGNGTVISIDGKKTVPILFALQTPSFERYHHYSQMAGVKLYHLQIYPFRIIAGDYRRHNYDFVAGHVRNLLRVDPDAYVIIQMDMRTGSDWRNAHPQASLMTHDGNLAHESFCSKEYRDEAVGYVSDLVAFVGAQPWSNRVIGYLCELGEPEGVLSGGDNIGDYNPQAIEAFRRFVRGKYGESVERLRRAYGDAGLTFEKVYPTYARLMERGAANGCFLDPKTQRLTIDYHEFVASIVPTFLTDLLGRTIKGLTGNRMLVGSYWAYMTHDLTYGQRSHQTNHSYLHHVLASPHVDFFASPFLYSQAARHAGEPYRVFQPVDALRANGKLHIPECDHRTFRAGTLLHGRNRSREETLAIIRRDLGTAIMHGTGAWLSDWTNNASKDRRQSEPFFLDDRVLEEVSALRAKYEEMLDVPRVEAAQTAVFVSGTSYYFHDNSAGPFYYELIRKTLYEEMNAVGAPYHELVFEDVLKPEVQNAHKCFIFLNAFYMTDRQRRAVESLKRDGKTLVWFYAPGYVSDDGLAIANVEKLTGFRTGIDHQPGPLTYQVTDTSHPLLTGVRKGKYGGKFGATSPRLFITDRSPDVSILGTYSDDKAALAARDFGTHKSIYCTSSYLSTAMLRNVLRYAGCHVYVEDDIYMDATRDVLMLTNTFDRERTLSVSLPTRCDVVTLLTEDPVARGVDRFEVRVRPGTTLLYRLRRPAAQQDTR